MAHMAVFLVDVEVRRSYSLLQARTSGESLGQEGWCLWCGISQKGKRSSIQCLLHSRIELKSGRYDGDWGLRPEQRVSMEVGDQL
jgi:hypothetical protein